MSATGKFDEHHLAAFLENVTFLREGGLSDEWIARRLNVELETLHKREERHRGKELNTKPGADHQDLRH